MPSSNFLSSLLKLLSQLPKVGKKTSNPIQNIGKTCINLFDQPVTPVTKSQFLQYLRCNNAFHLVKEGIVPKPSSSSYGGYLEWGDFLQLCRNQFPTSATIDKTMDREESFLKTKEWILEKKSIFHAHLRYKHFVSTVEYLEYDPERNGWILWDFRPIGSIKQDILRSFYFHKQVAEGM